MPSDHFDWDEQSVGHLARHHVLPDEAEQVIFNCPWILSHISKPAKREWFRLVKLTQEEF